MAQDVYSSATTSNCYDFAIAEPNTEPNTELKCEPKCEPNYSPNMQPRTPHTAPTASIPPISIKYHMVSVLDPLLHPTMAFFYLQGHRYRSSG
ncbi:hypothetical protein BDD12DRAFT_817634 [Trichophaea hybrida]|nr:hypothetical protein BDD12DRAFT_817634 [Trichophaea hybrida]